MHIISSVSYLFYKLTTCISYALFSYLFFFSEMEGKRNYIFENWAKTYRCNPEVYFEPETIHELRKVTLTISIIFCIMDDATLVGLW